MEGECVNHATSGFMIMVENLFFLPKKLHQSICRKWVSYEEPYRLYVNTGNLELMFHIKI